MELILFRYIYSKTIYIILTIYLILIYTYSSYAFNGASKGLYVWYSSLVPVILPVMILLRLIYLSSSKNNLWAIIFLSALAGIPTSSKIISDMYVSKRIDEKKYKYLLLLTANPSLSFLSTYIVLLINKRHSINGFLLVFPVIVVFISSTITAILFLSFNKNYNLPTYTCTQKEHAITDITINDFDDIILSSTQIMLKILGYIVFFSSFCEILLLFSDSYILTIARSFIEISCGVLIIVDNFSEPALYYPLINSLCAFGGVCGIFQILSILPKESNISLGFLVKYKMLNAIIAFSISYIIMLIIN